MTNGSRIRKSFFNILPKNEIDINGFVLRAKRTRQNFFVFAVIGKVGIAIL
jgi:hypothetical protein